MQNSRETEVPELNLIDILLVEDDENDVELTIRALRGEHLGNKIHVARDGVEALDYLSAAERQVEAGTGHLPRLILLDLKLPRSTVASAGACQKKLQDPPHPRRDHDLLQGRRGSGQLLPAGRQQLHPEAAHLRAVPGKRQATRFVLAAGQSVAVAFGAADRAGG